MQVTSTSRVDIDTAPTAVFKYLSNTDYHNLWNPHLRDLSPKGQLKLGAKYRSTSLLLGVEVINTNHVTRYAIDRELQIENTSGVLCYKVNYQLKPRGQSCRLICVTEVSADNNVFALSKPILKLLTKRELRTDLKALKMAAEEASI